MKLSDYAKQQQQPTSQATNKKMTLAEYAAQPKTAKPRTFKFIDPKSILPTTPKPNMMTPLAFRAADQENVEQNKPVLQALKVTQGDFNKKYDELNTLKGLKRVQWASDGSDTTDYDSQITAKQSEIDSLANLNPKLQKQTGTELTDFIGKGLNSAALAFADFGLNNPFSPIGNKLDDVSKLVGVDIKQQLKAPLVAEQQTAQERTGQAMQYAKPAEKLLYQGAEGVAAALPQAALAVMSGGTSVPETLAANPTLATTITTGISKIVNNPLFATSFAQTYGSSYENAIASGATETEAQIASTLIGLINSGVEVTGGLETLPQQLKTGNINQVVEWVRSALSEGKEEVVQGVIERLTNKAVYKPDAPLVSTTDPNAVFNPVTVAKEYGGGAAIGSLLGGGQVLANNVMNAIPPKAQTQKPSVTPQDAPQVILNQPTSTMAPQAQNAPQRIAEPQSGIAQKTATQTPVATNQVTDGLGAADAGFDATGNKLQDMITDYGAIKPGESPVSPDRIIELPKQTSEGKNVMQTMRTIMEAPVVTNGTAEALEKMVVDEKFSRFVNTDKMALQAAKDTILDEGYAQSLQKFSNAMSKGAVSKNNVALGFTLLSASEAVGDSKTSVNIIVDMVDNIRDAAQTLQAVRMLKKMQPEYQLYAVQRSVNNFKAELQQRYGDKAPNLKLDDQFAQEYLDALFAKDDARAKAAMEKIYKNIASQVPATFADKWNAWRYTAMLFNPITHIKNIVSNTVFRGERFVKSVLSASVQTVAKKAGLQFEQTRAISLTKADKQLIEDSAKEYENFVDTIMRYGKYDEAKNKIEEFRKIYGQGGKTAVGNLVSNTLGKGVEWMRKTNTELLETEDNWVSKPAFVKALASYIKANGYTMQTVPADLKGRAIGFAITEAQKASYRDSNALSDFFSNLRYRGKSPVGKAVNMLGEGVVPFRRTPANVLVRGLEYSPLGLAKTISVDSFRLAKGDITASEYIDNLSEGLTGTALTGLGVLLASLGIITVGSTGDDKEDKLNETQGKQRFAIEVGGKSYTIDWLTPAMMPVFLGVSLFNLKTDESKDGVQAKDVLKIATDITNPLLETSMLSGLNDYIEGFSYAKQQDQNLLYYGVSQAALGYLGQAIPTIGGRIARTIDDTRRSSFTDPQSGIPNDLQYFAQSQLGKIPFAENTKQPFVDQWGRTQTNGNVAQRLFQNFLSPGYVKDIQATPMESELLRLYKDYAKENEVNVLPPTTIRKYFSYDGEDVYMTADEYTQYKIARGQYAYKELTKLTSSVEYKWMTDKEKAKAISNIYSDALEQAKEKVMQNRK